MQKWPCSFIKTFHNLIIKRQSLLSFNASCTIVRLCGPVWPYWAKCCHWQFIWCLVNFEPSLVNGLCYSANCELIVLLKATALPTVPQTISLAICFICWFQHWNGNLNVPKGKYHFTADLHFDWFGFSCFVRKINQLIICLADSKPVEQEVNYASTCKVSECSMQRLSLSLCTWNQFERHLIKKLNKSSADNSVGQRGTAQVRDHLGGWRLWNEFRHHWTKFEKLFWNKRPMVGKISFGCQCFKTFTGHYKWVILWRVRIDDVCLRFVFYVLGIQTPKDLAE